MSQARQVPHGFVPLNSVSLGWWSLAMGVFALTVTVGYWETYLNPWSVLLAALLVGPLTGLTLSGTTLVWNWVIITFGWGFVHWLVFWQIGAPLLDPVSIWPMACSSMAVGGLAMTGSTREALVSTGLAAIAGLHWAVVVGIPLDESIQMAAQLGPVVVGVCYGVLMRSAITAARLASAEQARVQEERMVLLSRVDAREAYRLELLDTAGGLLSRIAAGRQLSDREQSECRLAEAQLRDAIRGRALLTPEVAAAARVARTRGAQVSLVDDRKLWDCTEELRCQVLDATVAALGSAAAGDSCTVRLHPIGRSKLATVLVSRADGQGSRRDFFVPEPAESEAARWPAR